MRTMYRGTEVYEEIAKTVIDTRKKTIHQLIVSKDIARIKGVLHDRDEYRKYAKDWRAVNLDEYVAKFHITSDTYNMTNNLRKIQFYNDGKTYSIVAAIGGKYFRIQEIRGDGSGGRYVDLDLKEPRISGNFQGAARRAERHRLTHFRMTFKKGTV